MSKRVPGSRLRPVADFLETVGFVSKGDKKYVRLKACLIDGVY
jgi:hypothetical protein